MTASSGVITQTAEKYRNDNTVIYAEPSKIIASCNTSHSLDIDIDGNGIMEIADLSLVHRLL